MYVCKNSIESRVTSHSEYSGFQQANINIMHRVCFVTLNELYYHTKNIMWLVYVSEKEVWKLDACS